jgi:large subunit ribosomal protein L2
MDAPLTRIRFDDGTYSYVPAPEGIAVGETIELGIEATATARNILSLEAIPDGTSVCKSHDINYPSSPVIVL